MSDLRPPARSVLDASPRMARWSWVVNGCLFAIGASVSTFVYLSGRVGNEIVRVGPAGNVWKESIESYLFSFPFFQLVLFLIPLMMDLNWRRFQSAFHRSEQIQRTRDPRFQQMDTVLLYFGMCIVLMMFGIVVFGMALTAALGGYTHSSLHAG